MRIRQEFPRVPVTAGGPGQISGQVRWRAAEGQPSGAEPWQAMTIVALVPRSFQPVDPAFAPANTTMYNGQQGTFSDLQPSGWFRAQPAQSLPAGYSGFDYTIGSLPVSVPVQLKAKVLDNVSWPAAAGNHPPFGMLYPKYVRGIVSSANSVFTLWPGAPPSTGVDLEVAGAWVSDPPGGTGAGSPGADVMALIDRSKAIVINPNPVLNFRRVRAKALKPTATRQLEDLKRALGRPTVILTTPAQKANIGPVAR